MILNFDEIKKRRTFAIISHPDAGKTTLTEAIENAKMNTRRFAKRQLTWFKKSTNIQWFDYKEDREKIINYIEKSFEL